MKSRLATLLFVGALAATATAGDVITPGDFFTERPTLNCLGFRWYVDGDSNRTASVRVQYRSGRGAWREALPLLRSSGEVVAGNLPEKERAGVVWTTPNVFAGSIVDLAPDTDYEVKLALTSPGSATVERLVSARTRAEPRAFAGGRTLHVYPAGHPGPRQQPAFDGLLAAYAAAAPGDLLLVHAGIHTVATKPDRTDYLLTRPATAAKPIVIRAAGDGEAVFDGRGALRLFDTQAAHHHHFEGLTLRGADHAFYAGRERGATGLVVRRCRFDRIAYGVFGLHPECRDFYIADNVFAGPRPGWHPRTGQENDSHAVWLSGQGHVVCFNAISGYWDGVDVYGRRPPAERELQNAAMDFHNNDISASGDDGIEMDYAVHNLRVFRNRIWNCFMGLSAQPVYGGPAYVFRNVVFNTTRSPLKPNLQPSGLLVFNNTFLAHGSAGRLAAGWQNSQFHNNLFLGTDGGPGVLWTGTATPATSRLDYNGWHFFKSAEPRPIWWRYVTETRVPTSSHLSLEGTFTNLAEFTQFTGFERHGVAVDPGVFQQAAVPTGTNAPLPSLDLRLRPGTRAVDTGLALPNFTDGFTGSAPDLGALELGEKPPHYGPRNSN